MQTPDRAALVPPGTPPIRSAAHRQSSHGTQPCQRSCQPRQLHSRACRQRGCRRPRTQPRTQQRSRRQRRGIVGTASWRGDGLEGGVSKTGSPIGNAFDGAVKKASARVCANS